ncbi:hypothetical protein ACFQO4_02790 [Saliphagus sp. GCM10025334]
MDRQSSKTSAERLGIGGEATRPSPPEGSEANPPDDVLLAIASEQRRVILRTLNLADEESMEMDALAKQVAEALRSEGRSDSEHGRRVRTALYHAHLPKLEACGLVVRDPETNRIRNATSDLGQELLTVLESYETQA